MFVRLPHDGIALSCSAISEGKKHLLSFWTDILLHLYGQQRTYAGI